MRRTLIILPVVLTLAAQAFAQPAPTSKQIVEEASAAFHSGRKAWSDQLVPAMRSDRSWYSLLAFTELQYEAMRRSSIKTARSTSSQLLRLLGEESQGRPPNPELRAMIDKLSVYGEEILYPGNASAAAAFKNATELHYGGGDRAKVLEAYRNAMKRDPKFSSPYTFSGIWHFEHKEYAAAEGLLRKAVQIQPEDGHAWNFLAQALYELKKADEAKVAVEHAVVMGPASNFNWSTFTQITGLNSDRRIEFVVPVDVAADGKAGRRSLVLLGERRECLSEVDCVFWSAFLESQNAGGKAYGSSYQQDLKAWRAGLEAAQQYSEKNGGSFTNASLGKLARIKHRGQLDAAVLLLLYQTGYRTDLNAWYAANQGGVLKLMEFASVP